MERSWGKSSQKLLLCVTVEAGKVGDYGSYYRLTHTAPALSLIHIYDNFRDPLNIDADEFIAVKGFKAKGKRITTYAVETINELEPTRFPRCV